MAEDEDWSPVDELGEDEQDYLPIGAHWVERYIKRRRFIDKSNGSLTETQGYLLTSALARGDDEAAWKFISDWNAERDRLRPKHSVSKWIPGVHYYALAEKFDTLEEAIEYLQSKGYAYGGLRERYQYREDGG